MSKVIRKAKCSTPGCDSAGDNLIVYDNNTAYCFACQTNIKAYKESSVEEESVIGPSFSTYNTEVSLITEKGEINALSTRKIPQHVCNRYGVRTTFYNGAWAIAFPRFSNNQIVGYKLKYEDGSYLSVGESRDINMFGGNIFNDPTNRTLIITEGEVDALTASYILGDIYHCTSLNNGAGDTLNFCNRYNVELNKYNSIILCFDMDEPGRKATTTFINAFNRIGKIKIAKLPLKDANEMVMAGRSEELKWALIKAEAFKPKQIVDWDDITNEILTKPLSGRPWPWKAMDNITHGFYSGKTYCIGSATSVGKTTFVKDLVFNFIEREPRINVGCFFLEQKPVEVAHKLLSSRVNQDLEQPDTSWWDKDRLSLEIQGLKKHIYLFDPTLGIELVDIINSIYYFVNVNKVQAIIIDNLTILSENRVIDGKRVSEMEYLNEVAKQFNRIKRELNVSFFIICHLSQDKISKQAYVTTSPKHEDKYLSTTSEGMDKFVNRAGLTWETGRMPSIESLYGGATVAKLADYVIVLARDTTSEDDFIFRTTRVKFLKTRLRKRRANIEFKLYYDTKSGRLVEGFS